MAGKVWFITGASSGFGRTMTEYALSLGNKVVATLRKPSALDDLKSARPSSSLLILKLDVTKSNEIVAAFDQAKAHFGKIDVVFNNAGYSLFTEVESTPEANARDLFDTNFWGASNVSREAARIFRENTPQGGTLLVNTSVVGSAPSPSLGYYSATKAALEALMEAMKGEIDPDWNIKITMVEAGMFATKAMENGTFPPPHPAYSKPTLYTNVLREAIKANTGLVQFGDPLDGVKVMYKLTELEKPPLRFALGKDALAMIVGHSETLIAEMKEFASFSDGLKEGVEIPQA